MCQAIDSSTRDSISINDAVLENANAIIPMQTPCNDVVDILFWLFCVV